MLISHMIDKIHERNKGKNLHRINNNLTLLNYITLSFYDLHFLYGKNLQQDLQKISKTEF